MNGSIGPRFKRYYWLLLALGLSLVSVAIVKISAIATVPETVSFSGSPDSPIASAVSVPANQAYFWTSGTVPPILDKNAPAGSRERYGDTKTQAIATLKRIEELLKEVGLSMSDVTYLRAYLVPDKFNDNKVDYQGWFDAYSQYFNNSQNPAKTARSTVGVAGLVNPDWLIEIEAVAVFSKSK
jgi:enamine deaminase RidA (YjgF/YER057c/UK114 family)